jgi:hypothetical protein
MSHTILTIGQIKPLLLGIITVLVIWRIYIRVRRIVGRQKFSPIRSWVSVCFFPILIAMLLVGTFTHPLLSLSELVGVAIGVALGIYGLRHTKFEGSSDGHFYTPGAHIGIALALLFIGRVAYKLIHKYLLTSGYTQSPTELMGSPLTLFIIGTVAGYFATYAFGLLRWRRTGIAPTIVTNTPSSGT